MTTENKTEDYRSQGGEFEAIDDFLKNASVGIHCVDKNGIVIWANQAELDLLGYRFEEYVGQPIANVHADQAVIKDILERLGRQETLSNYEATLVCKDGSQKQVQITSNVYAKDGEFIHTRCFTQDVTSLQEAKTTITNKESLLQTVVSCMVEGFIVSDATGQFIHFNRAAEEILGVGATQTFPEEWSKTYQVYYPDGKTLFPSEELPLYKALKGETVREKELLIYNTKQNRQVFIEATANPIIDTNNKITGAVVIFRDITVKKRLINELRKANDALEQFNYMASHDLQEPLRILIAYSELLQLDHGDKLSEEVRENMNTITSAAFRMKQLITDLLAYCRLKNSINFQRIPLNRCVDQAMEFLRLTIEERGAEITVAPLPSVDGSESLLALLFQNLIHNAIKFNKNDVPKVSITTGETDEGWTISVKDNGIGIKEDFLEHIFLPFKRLHAAHEYTTGSGMGLSICRKIIQSHDGKIWVESTPGEGSSFRISLKKSRHDLRHQRSPVPL